MRFSRRPLPTSRSDCLSSATELAFIGTEKFSGTEADVRHTVNNADHATVLAEVDGDGVADIKIRLLDVQTLDPGDFVL